MYIGVIPFLIPYLSQQQVRCPESPRVTSPSRLEARCETRSLRRTILGLTSCDQGAEYFPSICKKDALEKMAHISSSDRTKRRTLKSILKQMEAQHVVSNPGSPQIWDLHNGDWDINMAANLLCIPRLARGYQLPSKLVVWVGGLEGPVSTPSKPIAGKPKVCQGKSLPWAGEGEYPKFPPNRKQK